MGIEHVPAYLFGHFSDEVSRKTLEEMLKLVGDGRRVALLGFSDYTKHIINNFGDNVVSVFEVDPRFCGFEFRGKIVEHIDHISSVSGTVDDFIICTFDKLLDYTDAIHYRGVS